MSNIIADTRAILRTSYGLRKGIPLILQQGGTSSGKTFGNLYALLSYLLYDRKSDKLLASVVSESVPHLKKGAIKDFNFILDETGLKSLVSVNKTDQQYTLPNGSIVEFFSADNETKVRGPRRDILFLNEANSIDWSVYYQANLRTKESVILDWNPSGEFWFHDKILPTLSKEEFLFTRTTYRDNPSLPDKVKKEIERLKDIDPFLYRVYAEGKTGLTKGLIFTNVKRVQQFPAGCKKIAIGLDFGFTNDPATAVLVGELGGELYAHELFYETGLTNSDISKRLESFGLKKTIEIFADAAEPKSIEELRRSGWNIQPATKGKDSVSFGIDLLKSYPAINITSASVNFHMEAKRYKWKEHKNNERTGDLKNEPADAFNHCWDALRYYAVMKLTNKKPSSGYQFWKPEPIEYY